MAISVTCECGRQLQAKDEFAGRRTACPDCGRELVIPGGDPNAAPEFSPKGGPSATSGKAIASLILGIMSLLCNIFTGLPALILGFLGLSDINASHGRLGGKGLAISGIILGAFGTLVVGLLIPIALLLPAVQAAREAARRAQCVNNLKQIGLALANYESSFGTYPPPAIVDPNGKPLLSWRVAILPFIEQQALFNQFHLDEPWDSPHNMALAASMPMTYTCPSRTAGPAGRTTYLAIVGPGTLFDPTATVKVSDVLDGTSNTLAVAESKTEVPWTKPDDLPYTPGGPLPPLGSYHPGGENVLFADGSVRFLRQSLTDAILRALITRNGGEVINSSAY